MFSSFVQLNHVLSLCSHRPDESSGSGKSLLQTTSNVFQSILAILFVFLRIGVLSSSALIPMRLGCCCYGEVSQPGTKHQVLIGAFIFMLMNKSQCSFKNAKFVLGTMNQCNNVGCRRTPPVSCSMWKKVRTRLLPLQHKCVFIYVYVFGVMCKAAPGAC